MTRILAIGVLLAAGVSVPSARAVSGSPEDKQANLDVRTAFVDAWNQHDVQGMGKVFTADADFQNPMGRAALGREQIEKLMTEEHTGRLKRSKMTERCDRVRFFNAETAQVDCEFTVDGIEGGQSLRSGHITDLLIKDDGGWKIALHRSMIPYVAPARTVARAPVPDKR